MRITLHSITCYSLRKLHKLHQYSSFSLNSNYKNCALKMSTLSNLYKPKPYSFPAVKMQNYPANISCEIIKAFLENFFFSRNTKASNPRASKYWAYEYWASKYRASKYWADNSHLGPGYWWKSGLLFCCWGSGYRMIICKNILNDGCNNSYQHIYAINWFQIWRMNLITKRLSHYIKLIYTTQNLLILKW